MSEDLFITIDRHIAFYAGAYDRAQDEIVRCAPQDKPRYWRRMEALARVINALSMYRLELQSRDMCPGSLS